MSKISFQIELGFVCRMVGYAVAACLLSPLLPCFLLMWFIAYLSPERDAETRQELRHLDGNRAMKPLYVPSGALEYTKFLLNQQKLTSAENQVTETTSRLGMLCGLP